MSDYRRSREANRSPCNSIRKNCILGNHIAGGGAITVYRCAILGEDRPLVAKVVELEQNETKDSLQEASLLAKLSHPYLVKYISSYVEARSLYLIMEYCEGGDLRMALDYQKKLNENLFVEEIAINWFVQLCLALQYIHNQQVVHRDVNPSNIFLASDGTIKLGDFGLAKVLKYQTMYQNVSLYQGPEVSMGKHPPTTKGDIFAAGCVVYELCTGKQPFKSHSITQSLKNLSTGDYKPLPVVFNQNLRKLIAELLSHSPANRPSADDLLKRDFLNPIVTRFSPRDTGHSVSMQNYVTSTGNTVAQVLTSMRKAMSQRSPLSIKPVSHSRQCHSAGNANQSPTVVSWQKTHRKSNRLVDGTLSRNPLAVAKYPQSNVQTAYSSDLDQKSKLCFQKPPSI